MLRIHRETDYAIRVIQALATYPPGEVISSTTIQKEMKLPKALSLQIISRLVHLDLIKSFPGRNGGIHLSRSPEDISLYEVVTGMEGSVVLSECLEAGHSCELQPGCPIQKYWLGLQEIVEDQLRCANFKNLLEETPRQSIVDVK